MKRGLMTTMNISENLFGTARRSKGDFLVGVPRESNSQFFLTKISIFDQNFDFWLKFSNNREQLHISDFCRNLTFFCGIVIKLILTTCAAEREITIECNRRIMDGGIPMGAKPDFLYIFTFFYHHREKDQKYVQ